MVDLADERLFYVADRSAVVAEADPRAAFLACIPGQPLPDVPRLDGKPKAKVTPKAKAAATAKPSDD